jgi:hypothetical protein
MISGSVQAPTGRFSSFTAAMLSLDGAPARDGSNRPGTPWHQTQRDEGEAFSNMLLKHI